MELYRHRVLDKDGKLADFRSVEATLSGNKLVIQCCDINKTAESLFDDSEVEFFLEINPKNTDKLIELLNITIAPNPPISKFKILDFFYSKFGNQKDCFENIMAFLKSNEIEFEYSRW